MTKKLTILLTCFLLLSECLILSFSNVALAETSTIDEANELAYDIACEFYQSNSLRISNVHYLDDVTRIVEFQQNNTDYGFIKIEKKDDNWIPIDFVLEKNLNIATYLESCTSSATVYNDHSSIFLTKTGDGLTYSSYGVLSRTCKFSESYIERLTGRYACAVVALTEIARQNNVLKNNSTADTFNALWDYTKTTTSYIGSNGIIYGTTLDLNLLSGMRDYVHDLGYNIIGTFSINPNYKFFQNKINLGYSCTLFYRLQTKDGKSGHTINVFGWYIYKNSSGKQYKYLAVADGWHSSTRYILYEEIDFVDTYGVAYDIY